MAGIDYKAITSTDLTPAIRRIPEMTGPLSMRF
jgi:hypothetical protein